MSANNNSIQRQLNTQALAIKKMEPSYRLTKALETVGHVTAAAVTGAKVFDSNLWGYEWAPDSIARVGVALAALDEVRDSVQGAIDTYKGIDMAALEAEANKAFPELSEQDVNALPVSVQAGYRALQATRATGRFVSSAIVFQAAFSGDYGAFGHSNSDIIGLATLVAGVQQGGEGIKLARQAITGEV